MNVPQILLIDDDEDVRISVSQSLELRGLTVAAHSRAAPALKRLQPGFAGVVVSDIKMPHMSGLELLAAVRALDPEIPVILITGHGDVPLAVEALGQGAYDFIEKPFAAERLIHGIERALEQRRMGLELRALRAAQGQADRLEDLVPGAEPTMAALKRKIRTLAANPLDVLIVGETGTGKEHVARAIHQLGPAPESPFVAINLAAIPADQVEADLFGYVAGAFPGVARARAGRFEHGRGGTIFLDEISSVPLELQVKLLRVLEERAIAPLGSSDLVPLKARFIASSRVALEDQVAAGRFRDDLLYRINPITLRLPPLAERVGDVPRLFLRFVDQAAARHGCPAPDLPPDLLMRMSLRAWPGNLRELKNAAELLVLGLEDDPAPACDGMSLAALLENYERQVIAGALAAHQGSVKATYESLGLARKTLYEKMQKHGLTREEFQD